MGVMTSVECNIIFVTNLIHIIMKRHSMIALALLAGCCTGSFAQQAEKRLTVEVSNEWTKNKTDEPIVIDLNSLKTGFNVK